MSAKDSKYNRNRQSGWTKLFLFIHINQNIAIIEPRREKICPGCTDIKNSKKIKISD